MTPARRIGIVHASLALFAVAIVIKAGRVQLAQHQYWLSRAQHQQSGAQEMPAPRGAIYDETRRVLAESHEMLHLDVAPTEVREPGKLRRELLRAGVAQRVVARALDTTLKWIPVPGTYIASDIAGLLALRGVHSTPVITRSYAASASTLRVVGHVDPDNAAVDGIELTLDSLLKGKPGREPLLRNAQGQLFEAPMATGTPPVAGNSVVLTLNADLQEIAERSLADAVSRMGAEGGDIVILDPHDGEIRAIASIRADSRPMALTALTEPFEPGSTLKPFIAAALIDRNRVKDADTVDTGKGVMVLNGREIHDDHRIGRAPLADVLRWSSNIGIVKFAQRLTPREEFETLRDFGFGTPSGIAYPTEAGGTLREPARWSKQSSSSLAMGYELSATPLQLALAYSALANGGELLQPTLVKEVIGPDGAVVFRHERQVVRQVVARPTADKVRHMLLDVVDAGTALQAALSNYMLAGKTGTPRATVKGRYVAGRYNPNFVGIFPGDAPQYVIVVKLTAPQHGFYSAETAAPVTKAILQAAIAARDAALDRSKLASSTVESRTSASRDLHDDAKPRAPRAAVQAAAAEPAVADPAPVKFVAALPVRPDSEAPSEARRVPDVRGLTLRAAVRSLHNAGFRVRLVRASANATTPSAGELAPQGTLVRLLFDY